VDSSASDLSSVLLSPQESEAMAAHGRTEAAVLLPIYGHPERPGLVFTERRADLRRHAGEISFPGGRRDPPESFIDAALREAQEEIGLGPAAVEVVGALPPVSTFVTSYGVHPFVGLIADELELRPNPTEVEAVLRLSLDDLVAGYGRRRVVRRGMPIRTDTYIVDGHLIWGATARILAELLRRLERLDANASRSRRSR
jgi:8-oxo-dGTP pyrophosphatase MutT (NUDIX family)